MELIVTSLIAAVGLLLGHFGVLVRNRLFSGGSRAPGR
jgi:hypothetical protein